MSTAHTSDETLWEAIVADDAKAFALLFERHWSRIYTTAFNYLKDKEACSEIVHDIFLNLWLKRDHLHITSFPNYLKAAARYHVYKHIRTSQATPLQFTDNWERGSTATSINLGDEQMRQEELDAKLNLCLEQLPKRCREIFILSRTNHLTNDEIAAQLGISKRTVENQITYALQFLRESFKDISCLVILFWYVHH